MMDRWEELFNGACRFWVIVECPGHWRKMFGYGAGQLARLVFDRHAASIACKAGVVRVRYVEREESPIGAARAA